jgi:hypothetical protein
VAVLSSLPGCLRAVRDDPERLLRAGAATLTGSGRHRQVRGGLVALQVAIAVVVLSVAGVLVESFARLSAVGLGFRPSNIATFRVSLPAVRYATGADRQAFHQRVADSLAIIRAVAGMCSSLGIATIAEGVETDAQLEILTREHCNSVQGYLFGKAMPVSELSSLFTRAPFERAA